MGERQALSRGHSETSSSECRQTLVPIPVPVAVTHSRTHSSPPSFSLLLDHPRPLPVASSSISAPTAWPWPCPPSGGLPGPQSPAACITSAEGRQTENVKSRRV